MDPSLSPCERFRVRAARPEDVPALVRMSWQLAVSQKAELLFRATEADYRRDGFGPNPRFCAFVAEAKQGVVGMIIYSDRYSTGFASPIIHVQDVYVDDQHRMRGIGTALLAKVATEATERGVPLIELTMRDGNPAAKTYRRCGFVRIPHCATFAIAGQTLVELAQRFADGTAMAIGM
jgi:ribosomal protein S18 acetylase RimI-like enzyme